MFCKECGKALPDTARFCDGCGGMMPTGLSEGGISRQLGEELKARSHDAWAGFKVFAVSPVGGLAPSMALFDDRRATQAGLMFAAVYLLALGLALYLIGSRNLDLVGVSLSISDLHAWQILKLLVVGFVPFASLVGASAIIRRTFGGTGRWVGDVYTGGAAMLPFGLVALAASVLGAGNIEIVVLLLLFAVTYTVLILYAGCSRIACVPEAGAAPAVPIMLIVSAWLTKIIVVAIW